MIGSNARAASNQWRLICGQLLMLNILLSYLIV